MSAVRRTERIVHVVLGQVRQLACEFLVVGFLFRVKAQVFEQQRLTLLKLGRDLFRLRPNALRAEADIFAARQFLVEQHAQPLGHWLEAHLGIRFSLGAAQVRGQNQPRSMPQRVLNRG